MEDLFDDDTNQIQDKDFSQYEYDSYKRNVKEVINVLTENEEASLIFDTFYTKTDTFADGSVRTYDKNINRLTFIVKKVPQYEADEAVKTKRKSTQETGCFLCLRVMQTFKFVNQGEDEVFVCHLCKLVVTKKISKIEDERIFEDASLKYNLEKIASENYKAKNMDNFDQFLEKIKTAEMDDGEELKWATGDSWTKESYAYTKIQKDKLEGLLAIDSYTNKYKCLKCNQFIKVTFFDETGRYYGSWEGFCDHCNFKICHIDYSYM
jgi:hypothetical protein